MPITNVTPVLDASVRKLCVRPYHGHRNRKRPGCPNFWNKKPGCPPSAQLFQDVYDLDKPVLAAWNVFDLAHHVKKMRIKCPDWSWAQLTCCLYWQAGARKQLRHLVQDTLRLKAGVRAEACPEAMGVNITATMATIGVELEWPPVTKAVQVALLAFPL